MAKIIVNSAHGLEKALKNFKQACKREGILKECKERKHYIKPSDRKRAARKLVKR